MSRIAKKPGSVEAPTLHKFISELKRGTHYCVICLRTQKERRLTNNSALKMFAEAINMEKIWKDYFICYMCEGQAVIALQFFKAVTFAAAFDTILAELMHQKKSQKIDVFEKENFRRIVDKFGLGANRRAPARWEAEFTAVREASTLSETQALVFDVAVPQETKTPPPKEIYLIPDDPPPGDNVGQVTDITVRTRGVTSYPAADALTARYDKSRISPPDSENTVEEIQNYDSSMLSSLEPTISETLLILDEDTANEQNIRIARVESRASQDPLSGVLGGPIVNIPQQQPTPRLVPLEILLQKPKEVFTGDSLLIKAANGPPQLHPIAIKEGVTTVPSLDAKIINGVLICNSQPMIPMAHYDHTLGMHPEKMQPNPFFCVQNSESSGMMNIMADKEPGKRDSPVGEVATPVKKIKGLPENEEAGKSRIDWEDKIPMDVISFVDALDPNNPLIQTPETAGAKRPHIPIPQKSPVHEWVQKNQTIDIIDLC